MLRISLQTLRARRATLAGAFVAIWLAVTLAYATGLLMAGALGAAGRRTVRGRRRRRPRRPDRHRSAAARTPRTSTSSRRRGCRRGRRAGRRRARRRAGRRRRRVPRRRLGRRGAPLVPRRRPDHGHGWASAALTPYRLTAGRAPAGRARSSPTRGSARASGDVIRVVTPAGDGAVPRQRPRRRARRGRPRQAALFFADAAARAVRRSRAGRRGRRHRRPRHVARPRCATELRERLGADSRSSTATTPPTPTPATRPRRTAPG